MTEIKTNKKNEPLCDYKDCNNKAYKEIFQNLGRPNSSWCYLCRKHFNLEKKRLNGDLCYTTIGVDCDE